MRWIGEKLGLLFESRLPWLVLVGAILLGAVGNGVYSVLLNFFESPVTTVVVCFLLIVLFIMLVDPIGWLRDRLQSRLRAETKVRMHVRRRKGLIALVSPEYGGERQAVDEAAAYHGRDVSGQSVLRHCWLIAGAGVGDPARQKLSSREKADRLRAELESAGVQTRILSLEDASEGDDPLTTKGLVDQAFAEAAAVGLGLEDVIADYTGGTKTMTAGMILACTGPARKLQFMKPRRYKPDGTADRAAGSEPQEVNIAFILSPIEVRPS